MRKCFSLTDNQINETVRCSDTVLLFELVFSLVVLVAKIAMKCACSYISVSSLN